MAVTAKKAKVGVCCLGIVGILLLVIGVVALGILPGIIQSKLKENLVLEEGKDSFEKWETTPIPVYFSVHLFNCTNPVGVEKYGEKPSVQEVGPFVYKQYRSKKVNSWDREHLTVNYDDIKSYQFMPSMSADPEQMIYALNVPMLGVTKFIGKLNYFARGIVASALDTMFENYGEKLLKRKTARELIFEGYKVDLLEDLIGLVKPFTTVPNLMPNNTFGFLYGKNNSGEGTFSVYTGEDDISKFTQIRTWDNHTRLDWWKNDYCDMLNGTDGGQFAPPIRKTDVLYVYTSELCRSLYIEYLEEVYVKGILTYRFHTPDSLFASPLVNPDNQCFCKRPSLCHLSGVLDLSACRNGIPLTISGPHFFLAHDDIKETVNGLTPDKEMHESYVDIEPTTGFVLRASRKLQINFLLENSPTFRMTENVTHAVFPLLWITEAAEIDDEIAEIFVSKLKTPVTIAKSILTACIVLGLLWIVTAGFITVYILIKQQKAAKSTLKATYKSVPLKPADLTPKSEKAGPVHL